MKLLKLAATAGALLLGAQVYAQDPVTGTPDESLFTDSDPVPALRELAATGELAWTPTTQLVDAGADPA